jgi:RNA polymerase sigma factor (sigma-70 family)
MRTGDQAHTALVEGNLRYVVAIARKYAAAGRAQGLSLLDVIQEGNVGLTRAIEKFDVRRGFRVTTHVTWWVRQAITHALAQHSGTIHIGNFCISPRKGILDPQEGTCDRTSFALSDCVESLYCIISHSLFS